MNLQRFFTNLNWLLDFFVPRTNSNFSSIHTYLTSAEIEQQQSSFVPINSELSEVFESILLCSSYKSDLIHDLIFRAKFNGELAIVRDLSQLLIAKTKLLPSPDFITFVPPDPIRKMQRGYHLPQLLATNLADTLDKNLAQLVLKNKSTKPQTILDKTARMKNLKGVFDLNPEFEKGYKPYFEGTIWLIDDIVTTKTTMTSVAQTIKQKYPKINIIGIAVAG